MKKIKFETTGQILEGMEKGSYVFIKDDKEHTGGIYIFTSPSLKSNDSNRIIYDSWVMNQDELRNFINQAKWKIQWLDNDFF